MIIATGFPSCYKKMELHFFFMHLTDCFIQSSLHCIY